VYDLKGREQTLVTMPEISFLSGAVRTTERRGAGATTELQRRPPGYDRYGPAGPRCRRRPPADLPRRFQRLRGAPRIRGSAGRHPLPDDIIMKKGTKLDAKRSPALWIRQLRASASNPNFSPQIKLWLEQAESTWTRPCAGAASTERSGTRPRAWGPRNSP